MRWSRDPRSGTWGAQIGTFYCDLPELHPDRPAEGCFVDTWYLAELTEDGWRLFLRKTHLHGTYAVAEHLAYVDKLADAKRKAEERERVR